VAIINSTNSNQPLLTIAIPTYNRASYLDLCLRRISEEIDSLNEDQRSLIKVYVSDNASTDTTRNTIDHYRFKLSDIFEAVCNSENIGGDANIKQCYEMVTTPYVWIFGDDDVLLSGGLQLVLDNLTEQKVDILYVNNYGFGDNYLMKPIQKEMHIVKIFEVALDFCRRTNIALTFISAVIVRSNIGLEFRDELMASNLVQFSWVLPLLSDGSYFLYIENYVVAAKADNSSGYELVKVFGNNLKCITDHILKDKPEIAKTIQNGAIVNFFPSYILNFRHGSSKFSDDDMETGLYMAFSKNWRYYIFLSPLLRLPLSIATYYNVILKIFRRLFRFILV
jgi:glycosyltransferase involved in cell wall biosynthesis